MSQDTPTTSDIATSATTGASTPEQARRNGRTPSPLVRCAVCGDRYRRLGRHLKATHALTLAQYERVYSHGGQHIPTNGRVEPLEASGVPANLIAELAERCAASPDFLDRLAGDVGAHLLGSGLRASLAASLGALLQTRMRLAGDAAALLARVDTQLSEPWRLEAGGEMGAPTSTRDLATIHATASAELDKATDAILRASKLAIDERRGLSGEATGDAPLDKYRGKRDALPLADALGPGERSIMLALMERLAERARRAGTIIDAQVARVLPPATDASEAHRFD